jgi:excisionase family DNA binding protein
MNVKEASDYLGVSKDLLYLLVREQKIPCVRAGRRILFRKETIDKWMEEQERVAE